MEHWFSDSLRKFRDLIVVADLSVILLTFGASTWIKFRSDWAAITGSRESFFLLIALPICWIFNLTVVNAWETGSVESVKLLTTRVISGSWRTLALMGFFAYILHDSISRAWLLSQIIYATVLMTGFRIGTHWFIWRKNRNHIVERYLVITAKGRDFDLDTIPPRDNQENQVSYTLLDAPDSSDQIEWLEGLKQKIKDERFDGIILTQGAIPDPVLLNEISHLYLHGISAIIMQSAVSNLSSRITSLPHANWVRILEPHLSNNGALAKRVVDVIGASIFLILLSPVMLLAAIAIKTTSKGPILYSAQRVGQNNELFWFPKFRSMYQNADAIRLEVLGRPDEKMVNRYASDPRITPVGKFLRRWSIDELPQFISVILGTMSLVGPRPILSEELAQIQDHDHYRFIAKPGLTGIWQISGRKETAWQERMAQDTYYIEGWSPVIDFYIILRTVGVILTGKGAM